MGTAKVTGVSSSSAVVRHSGEVSTRLGLGRYPVTFAIATLTCALAPAYTVRWHIGLYPTTVLEDAIALTVAAYALESWRARSMPQLRTPFTSTAHT